MTLSDSPVHPGFSWFHHFGLLVPLAAVTSLSLTSKLAQPNWPQSINAVVAGVLVALVAFVLYKFTPLQEPHPLGKAIMLGLLHAEFSVFTRTHPLPSIANISFFLFMYFYAFAEFDTKLKHS